VIQDRLFHEHIKVGPEGAYAGALAAIDIALWDLRGKVLGQPVWKLLGGAWRELPFYASIGGNGQRTGDEVCRVVEKWLELGPAQVKIRFDADKTTRDRGGGRPDAGAFRRRPPHPRHPAWRPRRGA